MIIPFIRRKYLFKKWKVWSFIRIVPLNEYKGVLNNDRALMIDDIEDTSKSGVLRLVISQLGISYLDSPDKEKFEIQMEMLQDVTADMQMNIYGLCNSTRKYIHSITSCYVFPFIFFLLFNLHTISPSFLNDRFTTFSKIPT